MQYDIKAKETRYGGINFRSRLEAKWAAFFDLIGWNWTYEPVDFCGWSPDFVIKGKTLVYVEVKPIFDIDKQVTDKIDASGCSDEVLLVGAEGPFIGKSGFECIGWLRDAWFHDDEVPCNPWDESVMVSWETEAQGQIGFCSISGSYTDRITGMYDGSFGTGVELQDVQSLWREAHNRTRFIMP